VERTYLHPATGTVLGLATAGCVALNTGDLLATVLVAMGVGILPMLGPVHTRTVGVRDECARCGHRWPGLAGGPGPGKCRVNAAIDTSSRRQTSSWRPDE